MNIPTSKLTGVNGAIKARQRLELTIGMQLVTDMLAAGYSVSVDNHEDETGKLTSPKSILDAMMLTDEEHLYFWKDGKRFGWAYLVYGNDGWDVLSDYTTNLEPFMAGVNKIVKRYEETGSL